MKKRAKRNDDSPTLIIGNAMNVSSPVAARLPKPSSLARTIQRTRAQGHIKFHTPPSLADMLIPDIYTLTKGNKPFLLHDSGGGDNRFLIYSTQENLEYLAGCKQWLGDGTFRSVPTIFQQLYTLHGLKHGKCLPLVYILAPNKSKELYIEVLRVLKQHQSRLKPKKLMIDFETGFASAFTVCFPRAKISGCLFHFGQCIWRHVQKYGLQSLYNEDVEFSLNVRLLMALAFVPEADVIIAFEELIACKYYDDHEELLADLLGYFESNWVGVLKTNRRHRTQPKFKLEMWNYYETVMNDDIRTNNLVEGWHSSFNRKVRVNHAEMGKFINVIKGEQNITEILITQLQTGLDIAPKRRKAYRDFDERLKTIVTNYDSHHKLTYLMSVASVLAF